MEGPSRARVEDFEDLQRCIDACFPTETAAGGMAARWPHCLQPTPQHMRQYLTLKDGGRIVACLSCIHQTLVVEGASFRSGGIGQVSTLDEYRGRGLMTRLLDDAVRRMEEDGFALSDLGGDRVRYGRFGWEPAGREWHFTLTPRSVREHPRPQGFDVRQVAPSPAEQQAILRLHDAEPRRMARDASKNACLLSRLGKETWVAYAGNRLAAYAVTQKQRTPPAIYEFGGPPEALHALAAEIVASADSPWSLWSPWENAANGLWSALAAAWNIGPVHSLRVVDLPALLKAFETQLSARFLRLAPTGPDALTLSIAETGQRAALRFTPQGVELLRDPPPLPEVSLGRRDMARLLFGPGAPAAAGFRNVPERLATLLPLDFALWHNEMV